MPRVRNVTCLAWPAILALTRGRNTWGNRAEIVANAADCRHLPWRGYDVGICSR
jgi:hypothetical protein